jgi:UDPglucose--hexose-1-phosphate uridylyltransferase
MPELRVDPLSGHRTIVAGERSRRPGGAPACVAAEAIDVERDPFAPGHEDRTPPELYAVRPEGGPADSPGWTVRVVPNLFPALEPADDSLRAPALHSEAESEQLFASRPARGAHEVIVNAPQPVTSLADLPVEQVVAAVEVWRERMRLHAASCAYVQLIVNERREAGASLPHTHAQLYGLDFVPAPVARERERAGAYTTRTMGRTLLAAVVA